MSFNVENVMRYCNKETVDAEFTDILAEINYANDVWEEGETYQDDGEYQAGQLFYRKLGKGTVKGTNATSAGGLDIEAVETEDSLMPMLVDAVLTKAEKIYQAVSDARKSGKTAEKKEVVVRSHEESRQALITARVLGGKNGTNNANFTASADTSVPTKENVVDLILADQEAILENDCEATVCFVSPKIRSLLLSNFAKGQGFLPETNEEAKRRGVIGDLLGMTVKVTNHIGAASNIAGKITGLANITNDDVNGANAAKNCDWIIFDPKTIRVHTNILGLRELSNLPTFNGVQVDMQSISGVLNTNPERCVAHIHATEDDSEQDNTGSGDNSGDNTETPSETPVDNGNN